MPATNAISRLPGALRWIALAACLPLAACGDAERDLAAAEQARREQSAFALEQQAWRDQRRSELVAPEGWTTLTGLHWLANGSHYVGSDADNGIRLAMGPAHLGLLHVRDGQVRFSGERGVALTLDGQPLPGAATLRTDRDPAGASRLGFDDGRAVATVIRRGDRLALRVKHADAPTRTGFRGLRYWPASADWRVTANFTAHPPGKTLPIANIVGGVDEVPNPGYLEFQRGERTYRLEALDQGGDMLFLVFADRTSGQGSYGAGRYLDAPKPGVGGTVVIDFNQAYNPPCAFTPFATCPLPPNENRLDLAVEAGEKLYKS